MGGNIIMKYSFFLKHVGHNYWHLRNYHNEKKNKEYISGVQLKLIELHKLVDSHFHHQGNN